MGYPKKLLNDHEDVVLDLRPHWFFFFAPIISIAGLVVGLIILSALFDGGIQSALVWLGAVVLLGLLAWTGWRYLTWISTNFVITTDRVIYRSGVFAKRGINIPLERVNNVIFHQNVLERMIGAGDLVIESAGESGRQVFENVNHPDQVQNVIYREMDREQDRNYDRMAERARGTSAPSNLPPPPPAAPADVAAQLEKLEGMLQRGTLTQEEFDAQKKKLLGL
jgi:uncharacterized membrane protein YdbT with pleckstrin-like domain